MKAKSVWQTTVTATLITATLGTVALAGDTLRGTQASSGTLWLASSDDRDYRAYRDDDRPRTEGQWIGIEQVLAAVTAAGYGDVREIDRESYGYEVYAYDAEGRKWEIKVDGHSGEIISRERD